MKPGCLIPTNAPRILPGQRLAVVGRAGSGKTYLTQWFILRSPQRWVILDTKHDPNFDSWKPSSGLLRMSALRRRWEDARHVVVRPDPHQTQNVVLDAYLGELHDAFEGFGTLIDETYQVALGNRPGPGLTGLVTRGRAREQSVIMGAQRPSWVPKFMFSEANHIAVLSLSVADDRKAVYNFVGDQTVMERLPARHWLHFDVDATILSRYGAVKIKPARGK